MVSPAMVVNQVRTANSGEIEVIPILKFQEDPAKVGHQETQVNFKVWMDQILVEKIPKMPIIYKAIYQEFKEHQAYPATPAKTAVQVKSMKINNKWS